MGWSITLCSNKEIQYEEADEIVMQLPNELRGFWEEMGYTLKNRENWKAGCDIYKPEGQEWRIGGSYSMSGDISEKMALHLTSELEKRNHEIKIIGDFYLEAYRIPVNTKEGAKKILEGYGYDNVVFGEKHGNTYFFRTNNPLHRTNHVLKVEMTEDECVIYAAYEDFYQKYEFDFYDFEVEASFTIAEVKDCFL